jgi:hypothetical protein
LAARFQRACRQAAATTRVKAVRFIAISVQNAAGRA